MKKSNVRQHQRRTKSGVTTVHKHTRNLNFNQLKRRGIRLPPKGDADGDGVKNYKDCAVLNKKRDYAITSISDKSKLADLKMDIEERLKKEGYTADVSIEKGAIRLKNVRTTRVNWMQSYSGEGYRKTNVLSWEDWVKVNDSVNDSLDKHKVNANVKSLGNKFDIRSKTQGRRSRRDWEHLSGDNVGSMMRPQTRGDHVISSREALEYGELNKKQEKVAKKDISRR